MGIDPVTRLMAVDCVKAEVDAEYKDAKQGAEDYLANLRDTVGTTALTSPVFGEEAGEYRYGKTRAKDVVEYNLADEAALYEWMEDNPHAAVRFALTNAASFGKWWFEDTGEVPEGVSRVERRQPASVAPPKVYRQDREVVRAALERRGLSFGSVDRLLLGDGE